MTFMPPHLRRGHGFNYLSVGAMLPDLIQPPSMMAVGHCLSHSGNRGFFNTVTLPTPWSLRPFGIFPPTGERQI